MGNEVEALQEWGSLTEDHKDLMTDRTALEVLSWGVLNKGGSSNQLTVKMSALIGASMTRDAKAIPLIMNALKGSNSMLRAAAVGLAAQYADLPLQDEIRRLLAKEEVWYVRLELIKAAGLLRMEDQKEELLEIIGNPRTLAEEKVAAIVALVTMTRSIEEKELIALIKNPRAGIRELACQIISHLELKDQISLLLPLLSDANSGVRLSALNTLALLGIREIGEKPLLEVQSVVALLNDHNPEVVITAAWLALLNDDPRGGYILRWWVEKGEAKYARLAAGAIGASGKKGVSLSLSLLKKTPNPYLQVTLAKGLIGQRTEVEMACQLIEKHLMVREKWMWDTSLNPLFKRLSPSKVSHNAQVPNYPQVVDQLTRLELLQLLCIMEASGALDAVKGYLKTHTWGIVGAASAALLQEGDEGALGVVRALLSDKEEKVRIQAALILAMLGGDSEAVAVLKKAYPSAPRQIKLHILEAIAKVGDRESIAFLLERLEEPFQVLRVVAATAIIQCLYH